MTPEPETCITCGDEAVTAVVVTLEEDGDAIVDAGAGGERVAIDLVPDAHPGDVLLCHAGIALSRVEAAR